MNSWTKRISLFFLAIILCYGMPSDVRAQSQPAIDQSGPWENGVSEPWWFEESAPKDEIAGLKARWETIHKENAHAPEPRAGDYATGSDTHGSYLRWAPSAGFALLHIDKCAARVMGFTYGSVAATTTTLQLLPERETRSKSSHANGHRSLSRFLFVSWRGVFYLTRESQIADFGDLVAGLGKFNDDGERELHYYVRLDSKRTGSIDDQPIVPAGYERFIKRPIDLTVTAVGRRSVRRFRVDHDTEPHYESRTAVVLDGGKAEGVTVGLKFWVVDSGESDQVIVSKVGVHSSSGVVIRWVEEDAKKHFSQWQDYDRYPPIKPGWRLTTSVRRLFDLQGPEQPEAERRIDH